MSSIDRLLVTGGALSASNFSNDGPKQRALPNIESGARLGNYEILEEIGRGGTSIVYRAERCDGAFDQQVAIKVSYATAELRIKARQERDMLGRLRHPKIAQIFDGGQTSEGDVWFAMEFVSGTHIDEYCKQHSLDWKDRLLLLIDVCDAVHHAHQCLLVHRDIKPNNILVDDSGNLKLLDFGISSASDAEGEEHSLAALTPEYASPEQFANGYITTASDIYQVGRVTEDLLDASPPIPRLTARNLAAVVARATRPRADMRYASIADMRDDLRRALRGMPVRARSWPLRRRLQFFLVRHAKAGVAVAALALVFGVVTVHFAGRAAEERSRAEAEAVRTARAKDFLVDLMSRADPYSTKVDPAMPAKDVLRDAARRARTELADAPDVRAELEAPIALGLLRLGSLQEAMDVINDAIAQAQSLAGFPQTKLARLLRIRGNIEAEMGNGNISETSYTQAIALLNLPGNDDPRERAESLSGLADIANENGQYRKALPLHEEASKLRGETDGKAHPDYAISLQNLAATYFYLGDYKKAESAYREAVTILGAALGSEHPRLAYPLGGIAIVAITTGSYENAVSALDRAANILQKSGGTDDQVFVTTLGNRAEAYRALGRLEEAEQSIDAAVIAAKAFEQLRDGIYLTRAKIHYDKGAYKEAASDAELAHRGFLEKRGDSYFNTARSAALLSAIRYRLTGSREAVDAAARTLTAARSLPGMPDMYLAEITLWTAQTLEAAHNDEAACRAYLDAQAFADSLGDTTWAVVKARESGRSLHCR